VITRRPAAARGQTRLDWLDSRHTFSFNTYHDPAHMGFRALRVINDDRVAPGAGFPPHAHRDMEILSYVVSGALEHRDSLGTGSVIRPGEIQRMSAGTGVRHSEFNPSPTEPVRFLQIWIHPERTGLEPSYEQRAFPPGSLHGTLRVIAARDGADGAVTLHQDVAVLAGRLEPGERVVHRLAAGRHAWVQVARGTVALGATILAEGDGAAISAEPAVALEARDPAEVLVFDLS
jgi:hypothetical protein